MDQARQRARQTVERFFAVSVVLAAISAVLAAPAAKAAPGALDPSFGAAGEVTLRQSPTVDVLNRVRGNLAVGAAGANMVVISSSNSWASILPGHDWAVAVEFGRPSVAHDLVPFSEDGRVVRMVAVGSAGDDFALAAFDGLGSTIRTFGQDGRVTTPFGGRAEARTGVWTGSSYLVFGTADVAGSSQVALARYSAGGALDPSLGNLGTSLLNLTPGRDVATTAAVTPAGILVGGHAGGAASLARFRLDGSLDPTFGTAGVVLLDLQPATMPSTAWWCTGLRSLSPGTRVTTPSWPGSPTGSWTPRSASVARFAPGSGAAAPRSRTSPPSSSTARSSPRPR